MSSRLRFTPLSGSDRYAPAGMTLASHAGEHAGHRSQALPGQPITHWLPRRRDSGIGAVAQLGERLGRIEEVVSSTLICSTRAAGCTPAALHFGPARLDSVRTASSQDLDESGITRRGRVRSLPRRAPRGASRTTTRSGPLRDRIARGRLECPGHPLQAFETWIVITRSPFSLAASKA